MHKALANVFCTLIKNREKRDRIRSILTNKDNLPVPSPIFCDIKGQNNKIFIVDNGVETELKNNIPGLKIKINGNNNTIKIPSRFGVIGSFFDINSDNFTLEIEPTIWFHNVWLRSYAGKNQYIKIGKNTSFEQANITVADEAKLIICEDCMFLSDISIWAVDGHAIFDCVSQKCTNYTKKTLFIGNHVWCGEGTKITKNAHIYDNSIIGAGCVACKDYKFGNVIIGGNPGKIIKENISWNRISPYEAIKMQSK